MAVKTQREREAEQRQAKLDRIQEQVTDGSLVIRKMTDAERKRFGTNRDERPAAAATPAQRRRAARARAKSERTRAAS
jgi:hypothetical protein